MNLDIDVFEFWKENAKCTDPFSVDKPRIALTFMFDDHFIQHAVAVQSTEKYYNDLEYRLFVHHCCNDLLEREIGIRCYDEDNMHFHKGQFEVIAGSERRFTEGNTPWLESSVKTVEDVDRVIHRLCSLDMKKDAISDDWREARDNFKRRTQKTLLFESSWTGPVTLACNILGTTNTCILIMDEPERMKDFFDVLCDKYIEYREVIVREDKGCVNREGIGLNDDDCYLFPPAQYEKFCAPFLDKFFKTYAPLPQHKRRQHSDSSMGHLMGILNDLGVNEVNFGPEIHPLEIRRRMPKAVIHGQMPPFTLLNGPQQQIIDIVRRDFDCFGIDGGYVEGVAGVIPVGTPLENIRTYMWAVHTYCRKS